MHSADKQNPNILHVQHAERCDAFMRAYAYQLDERVFGEQFGLAYTIPYWMCGVNIYQYTIWRPTTGTVSNVMNCLDRRSNNPARHHLGFDTLLTATIKTSSVVWASFLGSFNVINIDVFRTFLMIKCTNVGWISSGGRTMSFVPYSESEMPHPWPKRIWHMHMTRATFILHSILNGIHMHLHFEAAARMYNNTPFMLPSTQGLHIIQCIHFECARAPEKHNVNKAHTHTHTQLLARTQLITCRDHCNCFMFHFSAGVAAGVSLLLAGYCCCLQNICDSRVFAVANCADDWINTAE